MKDPRKYSDEVKECWSIHQVIRSLGYSPDDIYVMLAKDALMIPHENSSLFVVLRENSHELTVTFANYKTVAQAKRTMASWSEFVTHANSGQFDQKILDEIFDASHIVRNKVEFLLAFKNKGFSPRGIN